MTRTRRKRKTIVIPCRTMELSRVRREVSKFAEEAGFPPADAFQIKVAVGEACANAIEHGSPNPDSDEVKITVEEDDKSLTVKISDKGVYKRKLPPPLGEESHRGRGSLLMAALMDELHIEESEKGTVVKLVKRKQKK